MLTIKDATPRPTSPHPVLNLGFRIFFLGAGIFAVLAMLLWALILKTVAGFEFAMSPFFWHGHQMIFGFALAVIAGFLLTAVKTWTNQPMPYGIKLLWIFVPWVLARVAHLGLHAMPSMVLFGLAVLCDLLFWTQVSYAVIKAVWAVRQTRQLGVVLNLLTLFVAELIFAFGVWSHQDNWQRLGLYLGLFLVIAMVLTIGRRVLPFFIEKGVAMGKDGKPNAIQFTPKNSTTLDKLAIISLAVFGLSVLLSFVINTKIIISISALAVAMVNAWRLYNWHHRGIWQKPLLWSLYLSFWGIVIGFGLVFLDNWLSTWSLALHALALSSIGLTILAMMARVSLGHTGRNIHKPSPWVSVAFGAMIGAFGVRVFGLWLLPDYATVMYAISQGLWIISFVIFVAVYAKILTTPRPDGLFG